MKNNSKKGQGLIGFMLIIDFVIIVSVILFFIFFKYHIDIFANEINNFDKFQNFPNIFFTTNYADAQMSAPIVFMINNIENGFMSSNTFRDSNYFQNLGTTLSISCYGISTDKLSAAASGVTDSGSTPNCDFASAAYQSYIDTPFPIFTSSPQVINMNFRRYQTS